MANELVLADVDTPIVALVALKYQVEARENGVPIYVPYYQVTIDPEQSDGKTNGYSPSKSFIRFGYAAGDELTGWQPASEIQIFEVIAEYAEDEKIYPHISVRERRKPEEDPRRIRNLDDKR